VSHLQSICHWRKGGEGIVDDLGGKNSTVKSHFAFGDRGQRRSDGRLERSTLIALAALEKGKHSLRKGGGNSEFFLRREGSQGRGSLKGEKGRPAPKLSFKHNRGRGRKGEAISPADKGEIKEKGIFLSNPGCWGGEEKEGGEVVWKCMRLAEKGASAAYSLPQKKKENTHGRKKGRKSNT